MSSELWLLLPEAALVLLLLELELLLLFELLDELLEPLELSLERPGLLPEVPPELELPELLELLPDAPLLPLEPLPELPPLDPLPELLPLEPLPELPPFLAMAGVLARPSAVRVAMMATVFFSLNMMDISWIDG